jgi:pilus assembly protein CpaB
MKSTRIIVLILALVAGLSAAWLAKGMLGGKKQVKTAQPRFETVKVLTASSDISLGNILESKSLKWRDWPKAAVTPSLVTITNQPKAMKNFVGATARASFVSGEPILSRKVVLSGKGGFMSAILPAGMRAVSTKISAETGAGGFILPNDRVDVILTRQNSGKRVVSETILTNVRVLAIDQKIENINDKGKTAVGKTATLELEPGQTEVLAMAQRMGRLSLALRALKDASQQGNDKPATTKNTGRRGVVTVLRYGVSSTTNIKR